MPRKLAADVSAVIWTTTPWTLPHNRALAFHPDFEYVVVETEKGALLLAERSRRSAASGVRHQRSSSSRDFQGPRFRGHEIPASVSADPGARRARPITSRSIRAAASCIPRRATARTTSIPARNMAWKPTRRSTIAACITEGLPEYKGKDVFEANPIVVKLLGDRGALLGHHDYKHSYPHCWRCHNPVIFRATEQWFIKMDQAAHGARHHLARRGARENWA